MPLRLQVELQPVANAHESSWAMVDHRGFWPCRHTSETLVQAVLETRLTLAPCAGSIRHKVFAEGAQCKERHMSGATEAALTHPDCQGAVALVEAQNVLTAPSFLAAASEVAPAAATGRARVSGKGAQWDPWRAGGWMNEERN